MAHAMKHTKAACGHMFAHFDRTGENISNENIDPTRTHLNYNLAVHQTMRQGDFVQKRCSEVKCQNRKDVNIMVSWVVTAPKDLPKQSEEDFFRFTYDFLENRYGKENVVSSYVHMDEMTPHMHFAFVPVTKDEKKDRFKVSAKEVISRKDLKSFHTDLSQFLEKQLGFEVAVLNDATREGNKSIEELKRQTATERLREANEKASKIVSKAIRETQAIRDSTKVIEAEYEAKKAYIAACDEASKISVMYPTQAKVVGKGLIHRQKFVTVPAEMWEKKHISANEKSYLRKATAEFEKVIEDFKTSATAENIAALESQIQQLSQQLWVMKKKNFELESKLKSTQKQAEQFIAKLDRVLDKLPKQVADDFIKEWNKIKKTHSKSFDMEW